MTPVAPPRPGPASRGAGTLAGSSRGMVAGRVAGMAFGFLFWIAAARLASAREVGLAAATVSVVVLCTQLANAGLGSAVIANGVRDRPDARGLLDTALALSVLSSATVGLVTLGVAALVLPQVGAVVGQPGSGGLFLGVVVLGTVNILLDQESMAFGRGGQVLTRSLLSGSALLLGTAVLAGLRPPSATALLVVWSAATAVAVAAGARHAAGFRAGHRPALRLHGSTVQPLVRVGLANHALTLTERVPALLLPVVVAELLSATANAYWYVAWMTAWVVFVVPVSVGTALFADAARRAEPRAALVRQALRAIVPLGVGGALVLALTAPWVFRLLGGEYAATAAPCLRVLLLALPAVVVMQVFGGLSRASGHVEPAVRLGLVCGVASVAGAAAAAALTSELLLVAATWVVVQTAAGLRAGVLLRRMLRPGAAP
jgi:O-antigen/teichoic acid export membrane protein